MSHTPGRGMHHLGLATHDMEATLDFYENVLGFPARVCEMIQPETLAELVETVLGLPNTASVVEIPVNCLLDHTY